MDRQARSGMAERGEDDADVVEPELDAELFEREKPFERCHSADSRLESVTRGAGMNVSAWPMRRLHLAPIDDEVEHAALEQELAALEAVRQLLADRLLDDARARQSRSTPSARRC